MITNEEIVQKLTEKRDKTAKTVTDKWITERAKRLLTKVTDETVLEDLVSDSLLDMEDAQKLANTVLAAEAKRLKELEKTPPPPTTPPVPPENQTVIPKEMQDFMAKYNAEEAKKALIAKKEGIFNALSTKVNAEFRPALKRIVDMTQLGVEDDDTIIGSQIMENFTSFQKDLIGDTNLQVPNSPNKDENLTKDYQDKMKKHGIGLGN